MENQISELIKRIMGDTNLNVDDLNKAIQLHKELNSTYYKYNKNVNEMLSRLEDDVFDFMHRNNLSEVCIEVPIDTLSRKLKNQIKRLEMAIREKINQINIFLSDEFLETLLNLLFYRDGKANVKDLRLINKNEVAIVRENEIELGDLSYDIENLNAGEGLKEEAYLTSREFGDKIADPKKTFPRFYEYMDSKINEIKQSLGIENEEAKIYFDRNLDEFYFHNLTKFNVIVTILPNIIKIYKVDATAEKWIAKRIDTDETINFFDKINFTLLQENVVISNLKERYSRNDNAEVKKIDIEMSFEKFKNNPFSIESLLITYSNLFKSNNYMSDEDDITITRLRFLTAEKLVQDGCDYENALRYTNEIFAAIKLYKNQIINAMNGESNFPEDSLIGTVKKLKYPKSIRN